MPSVVDSSEQSFLKVAIDTCHGLRLIVEAGAGMHTIHSMGILAGVCLEAALKACLMQAGYNAQQLQRNHGHNIRSLWEEAAKHSDIGAKMPVWAECLADGHDRPYQYRYPGHQIGVGIQDPEILPAELEKIIKPLVNRAEHFF